MPETRRPVFPIGRHGPATIIIDGKSYSGYADLSDASLFGQAIHWRYGARSSTIPMHRIQRIIWTPPEASDAE